MYNITMAKTKNPKQGKENKKFYVTTPIYYANSEPHIGTAYTTLAADIVARYYEAKLGKKNVLFQVGTDEHGQKIAETAEKSGEKPKKFLDKLVPTFKKAWKALDINYDVFVRTTDPRHVKVASKLIQKIYDNGHIYQGTYEGLYCVGCEKYLTEKELVDGKCPLHPNEEPRHQKEENYFFKLSEFAPKVLKLIEKGEVEILPEHRKKEITNRIKDGVDDISISRESVSWGVPIPWEKEKNSTIWVWIEALINYYSVTQFEKNKKRFWPADLHLVGKDILWFHTTVWFSLLLAAELPLPKQVFGHGFFTINGQKISKSLGNVIKPKEFVDRYGVDAARYLIITAATFGEDGNIKREEFDTKYHADLANGLGNLVARVSGLAGNSKFQIPHRRQGSGGQASSKLKFSPEVEGYIKAYDLDKALAFIWNEVRKADVFINKRAVWNLKGDQKKAAVINLVKRVRQIAADLEPFLPETSQKIKERFSGETIKKGETLFPRLE